MRYPANQIGDGRGGLILPPFISQEDINEIAAKFKVNNGDIFVVTYPRSGTTWTEQIVHLIISRGEQGNERLTDAVPWLETLPKRPQGMEEFLESLSARIDYNGRRLFTSHLPFGLMPRVDKHGAKVVYVARNPKDVAVSYYFHDCGKHGFAGTWEEHFMLFMAGKVHYGSYFDHVIPWWEASRQEQDILFLKYEDMKADVKESIDSIAGFLGLHIDQDLAKRVIEQSSFSHMAKNKRTNFEWLSQRNDVPGHYRAGKTGGWREYFSKKQSEELDSLFMKKMAGTGLRFDFGEGLILP